MRIQTLTYIYPLQLIGKDKEGGEDKRVIGAFKELLREAQKSMRVIQTRPGGKANKKDETRSDSLSTSASTSILSIRNNDVNEQCIKSEDGTRDAPGYVLGGFIVGSTSSPQEMSGCLRNAFVHKIEVPSHIPNDELLSTFEWLLLSSGNVRKSKDLDLKDWIEKACHGVRRNLGDLRSCLAYAVR
jgi:hypothetical protein